jgi:hypothetical protein
MSGATQQPAPPSAEVRTAIREALTGNTDYQSLGPDLRRDIAQGLVKISATALALASECDAAAAATPTPGLARAQSAPSGSGGGAVERVAGTTRQILEAVSFPRFVTELITGVFKALVDTNQQQMHAYVELIRNVAASTEGFADANVGLSGARQWLAERFPGSFTIEGESDSGDESDEPPTPEERAERDAETRLRLRPGASMPSEAALRLAFGLGPQDSVPGGDPENLVPLARVGLARNRQQMLATMVMLGMQRIVIESGRLHASMRFHIDARNASAQDRGSTLDVRNEAEARGKFSYGPWGAEARVKNTIGYVSTERSQTTDELNTDLDLNSSVELVFKTDYLPLDRLAGREQVDRIKVHTLNPEAEEKAAAEARQGRDKLISESETARRQALDKAISARAEPSSGAQPTGPEHAKGNIAPDQKDTGATSDKRDPTVSPDKKDTSVPADKKSATASPDKKDTSVASDKKNATASPDKKDTSLTSNKKSTNDGADKKSADVAQSMK